MATSLHSPATRRGYRGPNALAREKAPGGELLAIRTLHEDRLVGGIERADGQLAFFIDSDHWGQGYASEAVTGLLQGVWAGLTLHAVVIRDNVASRRVLERTGFRFVRINPGGGCLLRYRRDGRTAL